MKFNEQEAKKTYEKIIRLVIDADSLIYRAAHAGQKEFIKDQIPKSHILFKELPTGEMLDYQIEILNSMITGIFYKVKTDLNLRGVDVEEYDLLFTPKASYCKAHNMDLNFRYGIIDEYNEEYALADKHPGYKSGRAGMALPDNIPELFEYAGELPQAIFSNGCEADDVAYKMKVDDINGVVIACLDKDIYSGTPSGDLGHYNFNKNEWMVTGQKEASLFFYRQCMAGDSSDTIKGIHRYGPKTAEKDLPEWTTAVDMWDKVVTIFKNKGYSEEYAILMMRLVNLGQLNDDLEVELWLPPIKD